MAYVFDPEELHEISKVGIGLPFHEMCEAVIEGLAARWPDYIEKKQDWVFNLAAGATGMMTVLHGSMTEYLILFGSSIGTEAFSGRYHLDIWDWVISGEMWTYTEEVFHTRQVTRPGEGARLARGSAKGYRIKEDTWMLEYARGFVPTALPIGLGDAVLSAQDVRIVSKTVRNYGRLVVRSLLQGKL
jgi:sigma non-opioid intracellular receptor